VHKHANGRKRSCGILPRHFYDKCLQIAKREELNLCCYGLNIENRRAYF